jgi:ATPase subunit of ABC transporter with duplicated ATPase domains
MVGISGELQTRKISNLSGGQKCRLLFSCINILQPHVLLLDEPETYLDLLTIEKLIEVCSQFAGCIVLISHDIYIQEIALQTYRISKKDRQIFKMAEE